MSTPYCNHLVHCACFMNRIKTKRPVSCAYCRTPYREDTYCFICLKQLRGQALKITICCNAARRQMSSTCKRSFANFFVSDIFNMRTLISVNMRTDHTVSTQNAKIMCSVKVKKLLWKKMVVPLLYGQRNIFIKYFILWTYIMDTFYFVMVSFVKKYLFTLFVDILSNI